MSKLKPCPFCGANMFLWEGHYLNGEPFSEPSASHEEWCILTGASWRLYREDGWDATSVKNAWNRRAE